MVLSSLSLLPCPRMSPRLSVQCLQDRSRQLEVEAAWQELTVGQNSQTYNIPKIIRNISWNNTTASRSSWRRKCGTQSCAVTRPTTPDNVSLSSSTITLRSGCLCVVCDVWCVICDVWCGHHILDIILPHAYAVMAWSCCPIIREETIRMSRQMVGTNPSNHLELLGSQN